MKAILPIILLITIVVTGCGQATREEGNKIEKTTYGNRNVADQETAERLVSIAMQDPNVVDATAVVIGKYAVVGIDLPAKLDSTQVGSIKYSVAQAIKKDPVGANAIVTADADVMQRLREMAAAIRKGHPIEGIGDELADIVSRLIPQIPRKVENRVEHEPKPKDAQRIPTH